MRKKQKKKKEKSRKKKEKKKTSQIIHNAVDTPQATIFLICFSSHYQGITFHMTKFKTSSNYPFKATKKASASIKVEDILCPYQQHS